MYGVRKLALLRKRRDVIVLACDQQCWQRDSMGDFADIMTDRRTKGLCDDCR